MDTEEGEMRRRRVGKRNRLTGRGHGQFLPDHVDAVDCHDPFKVLQYVYFVAMFRLAGDPHTSRTVVRMPTCTSQPGHHDIAPCDRQSILRKSRPVLVGGQDVLRSRI